MIQVEKKQAYQNGVICNSVSTTYYNNIKIINTLDGYSVVLIPTGYEDGYEDELYLEKGVSRGRAISIVMQLESMVKENNIHYIEEIEYV